MELIISRLRLSSSQWSFPLKCLSSSGLNSQPRRNLNNNTASICKIHRAVYERTYPTIVILPDGSSINIQYHEPRKIIKLRDLSSSRLGAKYGKLRSEEVCESKHRRLVGTSCRVMSTYRVVMMRHGESEWTHDNRFCGWYDAQLSERGKEEAVAAGRALRDAGLRFDVAFTSLLTRAQRTLEAILNVLGQSDLPVERSWRLNERHYGALTGLNKSEMAAKYGEQQVKIWRRSFDVPPPEMGPDHKYYSDIVDDPRYASGCFESGSDFPTYESLAMTSRRTLPFWRDRVVPMVKAGKRVLIVAHGTSLRGIVKHLDDISDDDIVELNLPSGFPFVYELDDDMKPVVSMKFLSDDATVKKAMEEVANQGKVK